MDRNHEGHSAQDVTFLGATFVTVLLAVLLAVTCALVLHRFNVDARIALVIGLILGVGFIELASRRQLRWWSIRH